MQPGLVRAGIRWSMEAAGIAMGKIIITKIMRSEMSPERIAKYIQACELANETHLMRQAIYAKYNPSINELKAQKKIELDVVRNYQNSEMDKIYG